MFIPISLTGALLLLSALAPSAATSSCCRHDVATREYHEHIAANYLDVWNGDLTLLNATFSPGVTLHIDRFPSQTGEGSDPVEVGTSEEFRDFVEQSRSGWEQYRFVRHNWVADGLNVALRWRLEAVIGANFTRIPT